MVSRPIRLPRHLLRMHPATLVLLSFVWAIVVGTVLLMLPVSTRTGSIPLIDALFTATSAVCVTGLTTVDTGGYFTIFGQCVLLALIQVGGLGVMTISVALFRLIGRGVPFQQRMAVQDVFAHTPREDILKLIRNILVFTALAELAGAILLLSRWRGDYAFSHALYLSVFHSISAFCNSGFSLFADSFVRYSGDILINVSICLLIVAGGLGFPVLHDLCSYARRRDGRRRLAVQTRAVLITTAVLIAAGALIIGVLEWSVIGSRESTAQRVLTPVFQSITCRTAGFNTLDIGALGDATLFIMMVLMFVGASPGSTGGGVKTTTLALLSAFTVSRVKKQRRVNMFKKSIPDETVTRSAALMLISIAIIGVVLFMVLLGWARSGAAGSVGVQRPFLAALFETVSAFGTVGLSMGVTPALTAWSKAWIIVMMVVGRVGVLTFAYIIVGTAPTRGVERAEENVMVG